MPEEEDVKTKTLKIYDFLCDAMIDGTLRVIAYDMRQVRSTVKRVYGDALLAYLPGGDKYSCSDCGWSTVQPGMVVP